MSHRVDFADPATIRGMVKDLKDKVAPKVAAQVQQRNEARDQHQSLVNRITALNNRQEVLQAEIMELRAQGANRALENKNNSALSVKISSREAEYRENEGWIATLIPQEEELAEKLADENRELLQALRDAIAPIHWEMAAAMNRHLLEASKLRHSWHRAVCLAVDEIGDHPHLSAKITAANQSYRLKVDWTKSCFISPAR
jgi:hypothetical protein